jgi:hypothetical protein
MRVHHVTADLDGILASTRYRAMIPGAELVRAGHDVSLGETPQPGAINVFHKAFDESFPAWLREFGGVFDVTDFHFANHLGDRYLACCDAADMVTCSSRRLVELIADRTGRSPIFIPDPYEFPERRHEWRGGARVLWFGHEVNFRTLSGVELDCHLEVITGCKEPTSKPNVRMTPYSHAAMLEGFERADIVILPQDPDDPKASAKGANRAVNALRQGKFVVASPIPAYRELEDFIYLSDDATDMLTGIRWGRAHPEAVAAMVDAGQAYIERHYSPAVAAQQWLGALEALHETESRKRA